MSDQTRTESELPPGARKRFGRRRSDRQGVSEPLAALHAELLLLREENARLKAAHHRPGGVDDLVAGARALASAADRGGGSDDAEQLLVDAMVIRESLLELCQEIERSMVAFAARLTALGPADGAANRERGEHERSRV